MSGDTRKKINEEAWELSAWNLSVSQKQKYLRILNLLDRQAVITEGEMQAALNESAGRWAKADKERVELQEENESLTELVRKLTAKRDELLAIVNKRDDKKNWLEGKLSEAQDECERLRKENAELKGSVEETYDVILAKLCAGRISKPEFTIALRKLVKGGLFG